MASVNTAVRFQEELAPRQCEFAAPPPLTYARRRGGASRRYIWRPDAGCCSRRPTSSPATLTMKLALALCAAFLVVVLVQAEECTPGQTKQQDCNTCTCTPTKVWACTRKGCPTKREVSCEPGTTFKDKCNTCRCGADGKSAACTLKACPGQ